MGAGFYPQLLKLFREHGCTHVRQAKGSHEIWFSPVTEKTFSVPVHINHRGLANAILKTAGIRAKV
ncbi:MAG: type II toxin-antitoxin system HicA family toxin [Azoarcus sp.]|jgi:predicted RNA binding protein YcfA (HicA-like mRNA interferase family)|nr:type II toxin-antitoxin system HicA family toxin [Azoarcus sp.]